MGKTSSFQRRPPSPLQPVSSSDGSLSIRQGRPGRRAFTRSRSPAPHHLTNGSHPPRTPSPSVFFRMRNIPTSAGRCILPGFVSWSCRIPLSRLVVQLSMDAKYGAECSLLLLALALSACKLYHPGLDSPDGWLSLVELSLLIVASLVHITWSHISVQQIPLSSASTASMSDSPPAPRVQELRDRHLSSQNLNSRKQTQGLIYMTVPKNYRTSPDDGIVSGLVIGPLIASSLYHVALKLAVSSPDSFSHPPYWHIEHPYQLNNLGKPFTPVQALILSRRNAVNLSTMCSFIVLVHVYASSWFEARYRGNHKVADGERGSVPRSEVRKWWLYSLFTFTVSTGLLGLRFMFSWSKIGMWEHMTYWEVACASVFYQFSLYIAVRLAHRGFTLGELGLVVFGATALYMELVNLTIAKIWPVTTPYIKTYRLPTPLLIFQIALIPGSLLTGFLLSPLLTLSRHIAQRPARRLRFPHEKHAHRRALAAAFYAGAVVIVGGLIGLWTRWMLRGRDPWLWVLYWLLDGGKKWTRPALLAYWAALGSISVAGWNRQLARSRRFRPRNGMTGIGDPLAVPPQPADGGALPSEPTTPPPQTPTGSSLGITFPAVTMPQLPSFPNANLSAALGASEWLDAADKHVPTLGLNARRKFFHALAVVMFIPGVAVDPAFTHLAFSAAFALFTFAEYVRYFALYPFGAAVHMFMHEFLDHKDSGTAILSHFYLLTGCAGSLWFEAPSRLLLYTGILTVGVGDAVASICQASVVGKRLGRHRWSPTTSKTVEGSAAFAISVVAFAWVLRVCGLVEEFSVPRYGVVVVLASVLEALSAQNDNIMLPVYMWSLLVIGDV
ncbi:hypothetical protein BV25DRAFT_1794947 [Artomyces pyxidatus]|uniref:Uncharacterized protein n=1 Tax=Artomyces pyxidatus TaxID=48021 RepID=A0ACB8TG43_9AGAM|nr:hypothetical protein BV25DRAFT_1794947 [Artomyces pyxidatus]